MSNAQTGTKQLRLYCSRQAVTFFHTRFPLIGPLSTHSALISSCMKKQFRQLSSNYSESICLRHFTVQTTNANFHPQKPHVKKRSLRFIPDTPSGPLCQGSTHVLPWPFFKCF